MEINFAVYLPTNRVFVAVAEETATHGLKFRRWLAAIEMNCEFKLVFVTSQLSRRGNLSVTGIENKIGNDRAENVFPQGSNRSSRTRLSTSLDAMRSSNRQDHASSFHGCDEGALFSVLTLPSGFREGFTLFAKTIPQLECIEDLPPTPVGFRFPEAWRSPDFMRRDTRPVSNA